MHAHARFLCLHFARVEERRIALWVLPEMPGCLDLSIWWQKPAAMDAADLSNVICFLFLSWLSTIATRVEFCVVFSQMENQSRVILI